MKASAKASALIACITILAAFAFLAACQPDSLTSETASCLECHSGDSVTGDAVLAAQAQYDESGHLNGPRMLDPFEATTGHIYVFHGSNAMYTNGSAGPTNCAKCHSHQGFVDFINNGAPDSFYSAASPPGGFTCHKPHISGDFSMRKTTSETLVDGTTIFNGGSGNLCVTCHKSLTASTTFLSGFTGSLPLASATKSWTSSNGPHHGPQADYLMGVNHYAYASAPSYFGQSDHMSVSISNSCVSCHLYAPGARLSGSLQLGGHGMYLTGDVHGTDTNVIGGCRATGCHSFPTSATTLTAAATGSLTGGFETATSPSTLNTYLDDIRAIRNLLIVYFGTGTNFYKTNVTDPGTPSDPSDDTVLAGADGDGPIQGVDDGLNQTTGEWGLDWEFAASRLTEAQSRAFWNFRYFIEDKSQGIHNPDFAFQILYDAADDLGLNPDSVITNTRP